VAVVVALCQYVACVGHCPFSGVGVCMIPRYLFFTRVYCHYSERLLELFFILKLVATVWIEPGTSVRG
jgi:hypothetical protein